MSDDLMWYEEPEEDEEYNEWLSDQLYDDFSEADVLISGLDDPLRELPEDEYCVTCGREWGTDLRKDGKYYCDHCWMVWNS